jgi:flagella basal body P-ring formation protein FlgA
MTAFSAFSALSAPSTISTAAMATPALTVTLKREVSTQQAWVCLGDVADVQGGRTDERQRLAAVIVAEPQGASKDMAQSELARWLNAKEPTLAARIVWAGADKVRLLRNSKSHVDVAQIVDVAEHALRDRLASVQGRLTLKVLRVPEAVQVPKGTLTMQAMPLKMAQDSALAAVMLVPVLINVDGRLVRQVPVFFSVKAWVEGTVSSHPLHAGQIVQEGDLQAGDIDMALQPQARSLNTEALVGRRLKRGVASHQPLSAALIEPVPEVLQGARVAVELAQPGLSLQATGMALSDAGKGQRTRVRLGRHEIVTATVVGNDRVSLDAGAQP